MTNDVKTRLAGVADKLRLEYGAESVILFGSYAEGTQSRDSDVDLLVTAPTEERFFHRMATARRVIRDARGGLPVAPIVLTPLEMKNKIESKDPFILGILEKGIAL